MIERNDGGGNRRRRLADRAELGRWRRLAASASAVVALGVLVATAGLAQAGRLPSTFLDRGAVLGASADSGSADSTTSSDSASSSDSTSTSEPDPLALVARDSTHDDTSNSVDDDTAPTGLPPTASRLVPHGPVRVVDTRDQGAPPPPETAAVFAVDERASAVAVSVSVLNAAQPGSVLLDGRDGAVEAARLPGAGATTTNLVVVPVDGGEVTIRSSAGGHLVADVVGRFETVTGPVAEGRFVPIAPDVVAELETAVDGRELDVPRIEGPAIDELEPGEASAVLAVVTADVGAEGGIVRLGKTQGDFDQMLMWAPAVGEDRQRRGLVLLEPTDELLTSLRYDGGAELRVEIVGYFTGEGAAVERAGLFVPTGPLTIFDGPISPADPAAASGLRTDSGTAIITVAPRVGIPGQLGSTIVAADYGAVPLVASTDVDVTVILLGEFLL